MKIHQIASGHLDFKLIETILNEGYQLKLSESAETKIQECRNWLDRKMDSSGDPVYGINTGFGSLYDKKIGKADLGKLQQNLVMSHACGTGEEVPLPVVKLMLLLKIQGLAYGHSGVQVETVERLITFYNNDILPVIYEQGSLGASGDLAPLAHLSLPLLGMGEVYYQGRKQAAASVLKTLNIAPIELKSKEGLALLNGTQFMSAYGTYSVLIAQKLSLLADIIGALSLDAFDGRIEPFHHLIHDVRPHKGQINTAIHFREILKGSEMIARNKVHVQDPYSFRCIPQVHGATKDTLEYAGNVIIKEVNSVTDNPTIFPDHDLIISAGNFHGQPLALVLDFLAIAMSELGSISERRTFQLISGQRGLPPFLVADPGLNSGFMIPQYTAASIVSQNKQLCTPASVDSIVSSNGQEDHVSMGANAAVKLLKVLVNVEKILAIELFNAAQAFQFRRPLKTSPVLEQFVSEYRQVVSFIESDRILHNDIQQSINFLRKVKIRAALS
jgi:histidine ammonia-lyase